MMKTIKTMGIVIGTIVAIILVWAAYDYGKRWLFPRGDTVIELCNAEEARTLEGKAYCRWVIPAKYLVHPNESPGFFAVQVPWGDIDPSFPGDKKSEVTFQFWQGDPSAYSGALRYKKEHDHEVILDEHGLHWLGDQRVYFQGSDGVEIYVMPNYTQLFRLFRPLGPRGFMHWIVPIGKFKSKEAQEAYLQHNLRDIDHKLKNFIDQWH